MKRLLLFVCLAAASRTLAIENAASTSPSGTFWKYFPLNDPSVSNAKLQMTNRYSNLTTSQKSALQSTLGSFRECSGSACRTVEDK